MSVLQNRINATHSSDVNYLPPKVKLKPRTFIAAYLTRSAWKKKICMNHNSLLQLPNMTHYFQETTLYTTSALNKTKLVMNHLMVCNFNSNDNITVVESKFQILHR